MESKEGRHDVSITVRNSGRARAEQPKTARTEEARDRTVSRSLCASSNGIKSKTTCLKRSESGL